MGRRKLWASGVVLVVMVLLVWNAKIESQHFVDVMQVLLGSFALANGAEHIGKGIKSS